MRELKFRTWAIKAKRFIKVNMFAIGPNGIYPFGISQESVVIQQFTGLKDKNDKEIYEGDILIDRLGTGYIFEVEFDKQFVLVNNNPQINFDLIKYCYKYKDVEIIGNICQNPEIMSKN